MPKNFFGIPCIGILRVRQSYDDDFSLFVALASVIQPVFDDQHCPEMDILEYLLQ